MTIKEIKQVFTQNKGFITADDLDMTVNRYLLEKMLANNEISNLKKGVYVLNNYEVYDQRVLIAKMYPKAIFCLFSAWQYHELTTSLPIKHNIALNRNTKIVAIDYPPMDVHYWQQEIYQLGIENIVIDHEKIKIYDIEKSVCDAIKHRGKIGEDITIEVVKNYINHKAKNLNKLMVYAKQLRIQKLTEQYIKPLL
ncbi:MAG: Abortive infection protein AbiEi [Bacteroidetes bacterium]|nr:Abortive infection protein AbiEi [Bacteroidota bacterium]